MPSGNHHKMTRIILVGFAIMVVQLEMGLGLCPHRSFSELLPGRCIQFRLDTKAAWRTAKRACKNTYDDARLMHINSDAARQLVKETLLKAEVNLDDLFWEAARSKETHDYFRWKDGIEATGLVWADGEPAGRIRIRRCVAMKPANGTSRVVDCGTQLLRFACEIVPTAHNVAIIKPRKFIGEHPLLLFRDNKTCLRGEECSSYHLITSLSSYFTAKQLYVKVYGEGFDCFGSATASAPRERGHTLRVGWHPEGMPWKEKLCQRRTQAFFQKNRKDVLDGSLCEFACNSPNGGQVWVELQRNMWPTLGIRAAICTLEIWAIY